MSTFAVQGQHGINPLLGLLNGGFVAVELTPVTQLSARKSAIRRRGD